MWAGQVLSVECGRSDCGSALKMSTAAKPGGLGVVTSAALDCQPCDAQKDTGLRWSEVPLMPELRSI